MKICLLSPGAVLPAKKYGGTERLILWLAKELIARGHAVTIVADKRSAVPFARTIPFDPARRLEAQIPAESELVHAFDNIHNIDTPIPCMTTIGGIGKNGEKFHRNTVFVSRRHAAIHGAQAYVYNGLDFGDYGEPRLDNERRHLLFLAKASVPYKNVRGCIRIAKMTKQSLAIVGGYGLSLDPKIRYKGMLGGEKKNRVIQEAKALLFPVTWEEPFGLAIVEALYFGCPVFGTKYGSLPELVTPEVGFLANSSAALAEAVRNLGSCDRKKCHEYARENFSVQVMTDRYVELYERILAGENLNPAEPVKGDEPTQYEFE